MASVTERVGILFEAEGQDSVLQKTKELNREINEIKAKGRIKIQSDISDVKNNIKYLKELRKELKEAGDKSGVEKVNTRLQEQEARLQRLQIAANDYGKSFKQTFNGISSTISHIGSSMQTLGRTFTMIGSPFKRIFNGTVLGIGYKFLNMMTTGLSQSLERSDIMSTYRPIMTALAGDASDATALNKQLDGSLDRLEQSVLGLPTGLDEIVDMHKQLTIATGDITKAEQLAIASNKAYLAGGADEAIITQGKRMLQTLATTGKLTTKQWDSLRKAIPVTWSEMQDAIEGDLTKLSASDFMDLLIDKGINGKTAEVVNEMLHTYNAATANIQSAFKRMGQNILKTLDEVLTTTIGMDTIDLIIKVKDGINALSEGIQNFIRSNPDIFIDFFNSIKQFDWKGLLRGIGDGIKITLKQLNGIMKFFSEHNAYGIGRILSRAGVWGRTLTMVGGLLKGLGLPLALILTTGLRISSATGGKGLFGALQAMLFGKGAAGAATTAAEMVEMPSTLNTMRGILQSLSGVMKLAGTVLIASGTGFVAFKAFKSMLSDLREMIDIASDIDWETGARIFAGMFSFIGAFSMAAQALSSVIPELLVASGFLGLLTTGILGIGQLNTKQFKDIITNIKTIVETMNETIAEVNKLQDVKIDTTQLKAGVKALEEIYNALKPQYQGTGIQNASRGQAERMNTVVTELTETVKMMNTAIEELDKLNAIGDISGISRNINLVISELENVYDELQGIYRPAGAGISDNIKETVQNIVDTLTVINNSVDMLRSISDANKDFDITQITGSGVHGGIIGKFRVLIDRISQEFGFTQDVIRKGDVFKEDKLPEMNKKLSVIAESFGSMTTIFSSIQGIMENVKSATGVMTAATFDFYFEEISKTLESLSEWYLEFDETFGGSDIFASSGDLGSNLYNIQTAMKNLGLVIESVKELSGIVRNADLGRTVNLESITAQLEPFFGSLEILSEKMTDIKGTTASTQIESMTKAIQSIKALVDETKKLEGEDVGSANAILEAIVSQLEAMKETINGIAASFHDSILNGFNFEGLASSIDAGIQGIISSLQKKKGAFYRTGLQHGSEYKRGIESEIRLINTTSTVNITAKLGILSGIGSMISTIKSDLESALSGINVNATANVNVQKQSGVSSGYHYSHGGYVQYRANGGSLFKRRGTDTVPAMLTPGEFVQNKKAVNTFGLDFMRKINNLDVEGAMKSLYSRFGSQISNSTRSVVNNYNTVNNNQRVTQNVKTNNPNFAFKRSGRYVGAI